MNKRVLLLGGGLFTVLLATVAIISTYTDQSSFQANSAEDSLKVLSQEKATVFQEEMLSSPGQSSTAAKMNVATLTSSVSQIYKDMVNPAQLRLTAVVSTDRLVYRAGDYIFVEVLLFDTLKKTPYVLPTANPPTIVGTAKIVDATSTALGGTDATHTITLSASRPSMVFLLKVPAGTVAGTYGVVITNDVSGSNAKAFPEVFTTIQVRSYFSTASVESDAKSSIQIFGTQHLSTDQIIYGKLVAFDDACQGKSAAIKLSYLQKDAETLGTEVGPVNVAYQADNQAYFEIAFVTADVLNSRDHKVKITAESTDASCTNNLVTYVDITVPEVVVPFETQHITVDFYTESNTDLVPNTTQKIYFNAQFKRAIVNGVTVNQIEAINVVNGKVKAYNIKDPYSAVLTLLSGVNSNLKGYGSFSIKLPDGYMPFLEFTVPGFESDIGNTLGMNLPYSAPIALPGGLMRVPINIHSISEEQKTMKYRQLTTDNSAFLFVESLQYLDFSYTDDGTLADAVLTQADKTGLTFILQDGLFIIKDQNQLPLATFNSFPNTANFTKTVLFSYNMEYPNENVQDYSRISLSVKSYDFVKVIQRLARVTIAKIDAYKTDLGKTDVTKLQIVETDEETRVASLCKLFKPVAYKPYAEISVYNEDGPIESIIEGYNGFEYLGDTEYEEVVFEQPSITFSLNSRILESQDSLVVTFQTNSLMDSASAYLLTVKQKEQILHSEAFSFARNTNQKRTIQYGKLNRMNGGVFSVDLYRITDFYQFFQFNTSLGFCSLTQIEGIANNANINLLDQRQSIDKFNNISDIIANGKFNAANGVGECIVDHPLLANQFLTQVGSSQFFRRPQPAIDVSVSTTKTEYYQGETIQVNVQAKNRSTSAVISSGAYLSLVVTEELSYKEFEGYVKSLPNSLYVKNDISTKDYPFGIEDVINKPYTIGSSVQDLALEYVLARQRSFQQIYEVSGMTNAKYLTVSEQKQLPLSKEDLSRAYGFLFTADYSNVNDASSTAFVQTDILQFLKPNPSITPVLLDTILGYQQSYPHGYTQPAEDKLTYRFTSTRNLQSRYTQMEFDYKTPVAVYKRSEGKYLRETLYFQSGSAITTSATTITFRANDLPANYKVKAVVVSEKGVGFSTSSFKISPPFEVDCKIPSVMVLGDTYSVSCSVINYSNEDLNVTLQTFDGTNADQTNKAVLYNFADTDGTYKIQKITTLAPGSDTMTFDAITKTQTGQYSITFQFKAINEASTNVYSKDIVVTVKVVNPYPARVSYVSGEITTDNEAALTSDAQSFIIKTPDTAEKLATISGQLTLLSGSYAILENLVSGVNGEGYKNALELVTDMNSLILQHKILDEDQLEDGFRRNLAGTAQTYFYDDRIKEIELKILKLYQLLNDQFLNKDSTGKCAGWDYYIKNSGVGGSMILTSHILKTLTDAQAILFTTGLDKADCYQQSLKWILGKQVINPTTNVVLGNYTFSPLDVDANGRAPWNISQAFITYSLLSTKQLQTDGTLKVPDLFPQVKYMKDKYSFTSNPSGQSLSTDSDPYFLSLAFLTINKFLNVDLDAGSIQTDTAADITALKTAAISYMTQVQYNQFAAPFFVNGNNSFDTFLPYKTFPYTPFNSYGTDRIVETTAICVQALIEYEKQVLVNNFGYTTITGVEAIIDNAMAFIKKNYKSNLFGSYPATQAAIVATYKYEQSPYFALQPRTHNEFTKAQEITVTGQVNALAVHATKVITQDFGLPKFLDLSLGDRGFSVNTDYTINLNMASDAGAGEKNSYFLYQSEVSYNDQSYTGLEEKETKIAIEVYSNGDLQSAAVNSVVAYQISLLNLDRGRTHNGGKLTIRVSPCLAINTADLDLGVANGDFTNYAVDLANHRVYIYIRGISPFGFPTFTLGFKKQYSGVCNERHFSAELYNYFDSQSHTFPKQVGTL